MGKISSRDRARLASLDALYARLPTLQCQRRCGVACGAIVLTDLEARRLQHDTGRKPKTISLTERRADGTPQERCVYLHGTTCTAYEARPFICRAWGAVKALSCPHGCLPERWLDDAEMLEIAEAVERLGGGRLLRTTVDGLGHDPLESWQAIRATAILHRSPFRSKAARDADSDRTRTLRALHGGRIIAVIDHTRE